MSAGGGNRSAAGDRQPCPRCRWPSGTPSHDSHPMSTTVTFAGDLTDDPEVDYAREGKPYVRFGAMFIHRYQDAQDEWHEEEPTAHDVRVYGVAVNNIADSFGPSGLGAGSPCTAGRRPTAGPTRRPATRRSSRSTTTSASSAPGPSERRSESGGARRRRPSEQRAWVAWRSLRLSRGAGQASVCEVAPMPHGSCSWLRPTGLPTASGVIRSCLRPPQWPNVQIAAHARTGRTNRPNQLLGWFQRRSRTTRRSAAALSDAGGAEFATLS